jgi:signal transduction histidine kinase
VTLLENALLHGKGSVQLRAVQEKGRIILSIQDEGPGLPPGIVKALTGSTSPQLPSTTFSPNPGQQLGLLMLRRLTRNEGWGLSLENLDPGFKACLVIQT